MGSVAEVVKKFQGQRVVYAPVRASRARFEACLERAQRVLQRRRAGFSGLGRPHLCPGYVTSWFQVRAWPCACMVSDAIHASYVPSVGERYVTDATSYTAHHRVMATQYSMYMRSLGPVAIIWGAKIIF